MKANHPNTASESEPPTKSSLKRHSTIFDRLRQFSDNLRQLRYPAEFRIRVPQFTRSKSPPTDLTAARRLANVATCLWDIERKLKPTDNEEQNKKHRLAYRRANNAIETLTTVGIVIDDPIGRRYHPGSEGMMKPHLQPTQGVTIEKITETVTPIIYYKDKLIQRGEVFVAVPQEVDDTSKHAVDSDEKPSGPEPEQTENTSNKQD